MKYYSFESYEKMSAKAASMVAAQITLKEDCVLGLPTGSTPIRTYEILSDMYKNGALDFAQVHTVNLDEYCGISKGNEQSYRSFMNHKLFDNVNIDIENTNIPNGMASDLSAECIRYDELIDCLGGIDLQLLGIGNNGHIGFNEPSRQFSKDTNCIDLTEDTIQANKRFFNDISEVPRKAITMGMRSILHARKIVLIANSLVKEKIIRAAIEGPITPFVPASILQLHPDVTILYSKK